MNELENRKGKPVLTRRPSEEAAAQNMNMKVIDGLAAVGLAVDHEAGAVFGAAGVFGEFLGLEKQPSKEG